MQTIVTNIAQVRNHVSAANAFTNFIFDCAHNSTIRAVPAILQTCSHTSLPSLSYTAWFNGRQQRMPVLVVVVVW